MRYGLCPHSDTNISSTRADLGALDPSLLEAKLTSRVAAKNLLNLRLAVARVTPPAINP